MKHASVLDSLTGAVRDLADVLPPLEHAIAEHQTARRCEGRRPTPSSRPPWNPQAAFVLFDIHHGVRGLEADLQTATSGTVRPRGGATSTTYVLLDQIVPLAAGVEHTIQLVALHKVTTWTWRGKVALGWREPVQRVYREEGQPEPRCPWCKKMTLRMRPSLGQVLCVNPDCKDSEDRRRVARVEIGEVFESPLLIWQDDSIGLAVTEETQ